MRPVLSSPFATPDEVAAVEQELGMSLPQTYRAFVLRGNCKPVPCCWGSGQDLEGIFAMYGIDDLLGMTDQEDLDLGKLKVAETEMGNHFAIDLAEGSIFFCDHEVPYDDDGSGGRFRLVAPSFDAFLDGFHSDCSAEANRA